MAADSTVIWDAALEEFTGITFNEGDAFVTVDNAGIYRIHYNIKTILANGATMQLLINGVPVINSGIPMLLDVSDRTGIATLSLDAGDTVAIGITGTTVTLGPPTNAFLDILRLA